MNRPIATVVAWLALSAACTEGGVVSRDAAPDVDADEFSLCAIPCDPGFRCASFRCVRVSDAGVDASTDRPVASFDAEFPTCCPIDGVLSCGCVRLGGARVAGRECPRACNIGFPEFWTRRIDERGCPRWSTSGVACRDAAEDLVDAVADD